MRTWGRIKWLLNVWIDHGEMKGSSDKFLVRDQGRMQHYRGGGGRKLSGNLTTPILSHPLIIFFGFFLNISICYIHEKNYTH